MNDYDWIVVGSGFGGSVSALRLVEKGYRVGVLECGKRFRDEDFPESTWDLRRYFWAPRMGMRGIFRLTPFKDVSVSAAAESAAAASAMPTRSTCPPRTSSRIRSGATSTTGRRRSPPTTPRRSGCWASSSYEDDDPADQLLREFGEQLGVGDTYRKTPIGVFLGKPGKTVPDPYFGGEGPDRTGCMHCGGCMVGCPHGAKNTLVKNYLWLAERLGVEVMPERTVTEIRPLGPADGSEGYAVTSERSGILRAAGGAPSPRAA